MVKFLWLALLPAFILLAEAKRVNHATKRLEDKPREFISLGSMDEVLQSTSLLENSAVTKLNISLEKLAEKSNGFRPNPQPLVQHIQRVQIHAPSNPNAPIDRETYTKAVTILRKMAPNLQTVSLIGGHMFKPVNENRPDSIKDEIVFVRNYLKTVIYEFESQNITVEDVRFIVGIIAPEKTQSQIDFGRLIRSTFGYQPLAEELESKTVGMIVQMNETTCYLGIGMNPSKKEDGWMTPTSIISTGRSKFQEQVILTNFKKEWYSRIFDMINTEPATMHAKHRVNDLSRHRLFVKSASLDDPTVRAVGRTSNLPRKLFVSHSEMDFMQFQQPPQLQLEDFFDKHVDSIQVENAVKKLGLKVSVQNRTAPSRMYKNAVENLKKLVPNLNEVSLYGGYVFHPRKPSRDTVQNEIDYLAHNIRTWIEIFNEAGINVTEIRFVATFVVSDKIRETSKYKEALQNSFHYTATKMEIEQNAVRMRLEFNGVPIHVGIHFRDADRDQTYCPAPVDIKAERYAQFNYFCDEKRPFQQWYKSIWNGQQFSW